jgi:hypothetical protein
MTGHTSHIDPTRRGKHRRALLSLVTTLAFLATLAVAVARFPHTELGRVLDTHLTQLADPRSWIP